MLRKNDSASVPLKYHSPTVSLARWLPKSSLQVVNWAAQLQQPKEGWDRWQIHRKGQVNSKCALFNVVVKTAISPLGVCLCGYHQSNRSLVKDCGAPPPQWWAQACIFLMLSSAFLTRLLVNCEMVWIRRALGKLFSSPGFELFICFLGWGYPTDAWELQSSGFTCSCGACAPFNASIIVRAY